MFSAVIIIRALLYYDETGKFNYPLPNAMNISFDFGLFLRFYLAVLFLPGTTFFKFFSEFIMSFSFFQAWSIFCNICENNGWRNYARRKAERWRRNRTLIRVGRWVSPFVVIFIEVPRPRRKVSHSVPCSGVIQFSRVVEFVPYLENLPLPPPCHALFFSELNLDCRNKIFYWNLWDDFWNDGSIRFYFYCILRKYVLVRENFLFQVSRKNFRRRVAWRDEGWRKVV